MFVFYSCSPTRRIPADKALVTKVKISGIESELKDEAFTYIRQKPNKKILFVFRFYLGVYNLFDRGKQTKFKRDVKEKVGEEPVIFDSVLTDFSARQVNDFLKNKGYFNSIVKYNTIIKNKKASVEYLVEMGIPYTIRNIAFLYPDSSIKYILEQNKNERLIKSGNKYDADILKQEQQRITALLKNRGYFDFLRQFIVYNIDSNLKSYQVDVRQNILPSPDSLGHRIFSIRDSYISVQAIDPYFRKKYFEDTTLINNQFYYHDREQRFNPIIFKNILFQKEGDIYNQTNSELTYSRISDLGSFRSTLIRYQKAEGPGNVLDMYIDAIPSKREFTNIGAEAIFNSNNIGGSGNFTFTNRNAFKGAETVQLTLKGAFEDQRRVNLPIRNESAITFNIFLPRLLVPSFIKNSYRYGIPKTLFTASYTFENSSDYRRRIFNILAGYEWTETRKISHKLYLLDVNLVQASISDNLRKLFQDAGNIVFLRSFEPHLSFGSRYIYTYNNQVFGTKKDFIYFRFILDVAGNSIYSLRKSSGLTDNKKNENAINLPYYQYLKPEIDFRFTSPLSGRKSFVYRISPGIGLAYGNSEVMPFEKQFFVGGSNSIRGWRSREIGPGGYNIADGDSTANLLRYNRSGELKFETNVEYRFGVINSLFGAKLNGATFIDAGNVWFRKRDSSNTGLEYFAWKRAISDLALATGAGLRFDYGFFIFRFDVGLKIRDPQFEGSDKWVIKNFGNQSFRDDYKTRNSGFSYSFLNYNLGIGYPF